MNYPNSGNFDNQNNNSRYGFMDPRYNINPDSYGSRPQKKNNNNILIIVLISVVTILLCAIIAITAVFILKSKSESTPPITQNLTQLVDVQKIASITADVATQLNNPTFDTYVTYISNAEIFVRSGPGKSNSIVLKIKGGDTSIKLVSTGKTATDPDDSQYEWYEVTIPSGQTAWVREDVVTLDGPNPAQRKSRNDNTGTNKNGTTGITPNVTYVTKSTGSEIFVRSGPGKSYKVVYTIGKGDTSKKLITTGTAQYDSGGYLWYQVTTPDGQTAWVRNDIVTKDNTDKLYNADYTTVRAIKLVTNSNHSKIYARSGAGKNYSVVYTVAAGDTTQIFVTSDLGRTDSNGDPWYYVTMPNGDQGWIFSGDVKEAP